MKNLRKKTGCLVMAVMLLIMTFVPAMSVTVSAAANIESRLITVGGKTVNSGMKIAEVEKLFGKPKLTTPSSNPQIKNPNLIYPGNEVRLP